MATKQEIIAQLKAKGITADESMHPATLAKMLKDTDQPPTLTNVAPATTPKTEPTAPANEAMVKLSDVKNLIAEAIAQSKIEANAPIKMKKVTEHHAHVWRLDGKWIVDFADRNIDKATGNKIDPYIKEKLHAYQKWNEQKREFEAWIEVVFQDGSTKDISLPSYVKNRVLVYCPITERFKKDISYSIGEVEKKKEVGDKLVGTGVMVEQTVEMYEETFKVKTPDGEILTIPAYAIS